MTKIQNEKMCFHLHLWIWPLYLFRALENSDLEFVSGFEFRASDLKGP